MPPYYIHSPLVWSSLHLPKLKFPLSFSYFCFHCNCVLLSASLELLLLFSFMISYWFLVFWSYFRLITHMSWHKTRTHKRAVEKKWHQSSWVSFTPFSMILFWILFYQLFCIFKFYGLYILGWLLQWWIIITKNRQRKMFIWLT